MIVEGEAMDGDEAVTPSSMSMTREAHEAVGSEPGIDNVEIKSIEEGGIGARQALSQQEIDSRLRGLLKKEQVNCYTRLEKMRLQPRVKSKISIPLCRMISLPIVRPFLRNDVLNLASHFVSCGYLEGNGVFYVSMEDNEGRTKAVTEEIVATWSDNWASVNAEFEKFLQSDDDLCVFSGKMFMVWDGNHRLQAWLPIINEDHGHDRSWHFCVESILLVVNGNVASLVSSLHDINWRNQKSHVTSNLVHKLYWVQNVGKQPLSYFEKFVSKDDLATAEAKQKSKQRTWFSLTVDCLNGLLN